MAIQLRDYLLLYCTKLHPYPDDERYRKVSGRPTGLTRTIPLAAPPRRILGHPAPCHSSSPPHTEGVRSLPGLKGALVVVEVPGEVGKAAIRGDMTHSVEGSSSGST